jgi:hypothetical protein
MPCPSIFLRSHFGQELSPFFFRFRHRASQLKLSLEDLEWANMLMKDPG